MADNKFFDDLPLHSQRYWFFHAIVDGLALALSITLAVLYPYPWFVAAMALLAILSATALWFNVTAARIQKPPSPPRTRT